jgi:hypothetical protein
VSVAHRRYRVYGIILESAIPLPRPYAAPGHSADVSLRQAHPRRIARARRLARLPSRSRWFECRSLDDGATYLRWSGLFEFLISPDARTIEYAPLEGATDESLTTYLLGQVLSFSLLSRGSEPLHATAVVIDGEAVAFLGDCGYGKSTLGAAFVARGFPILTDDVLALERRAGRWFAHAGPPRLKLFPSVARQVLARAEGSRLNTGTSKLVLPLTRREASRGPVPLKALYVIPGPGRRPDRIAVSALEGQRAFLAIVRAAFNLIRVDRERLRSQFTAASQLARDVPLRTLRYPRRLSLLGDVCGAVIADAANLTASRP